MNLLYKCKVLVLVLIVAIGGLIFANGVSVNEVNADKGAKTPVIVIDAGHGGIDGGVSGKVTKVKESDINLAISFKLSQKLTQAGYKVVMTRTDEDGLYGTTTKGFKRRDMQKRAEIIRNANADLVISIHQNSHSSTYRTGPQVFFQKEIIESKKFAEIMQQTLNKRLEIKNRFLAGDYFILKCGVNASVIVECGFLSNAYDEQRLQKDEYQNTLVEAIHLGIVNYFITSKF